MAGNARSGRRRKLPEERKLTGNRVPPQAEAKGGAQRPITYGIEETQAWTAAVVAMPRPATRSDETALRDYVEASVSITRIDRQTAEEGMTILSPYFGLRRHPLLSYRAQLVKQRRVAASLIGLDEYSRRKIDAPQPEPWGEGWSMEVLLAETEEEALRHVPKGFTDPGPGTSPEELKLLGETAGRLQRKLLQRLQWRNWKLYPADVCQRQLAEVIAEIGRKKDKTPGSKAEETTSSRM